jgi:signal transduction histidine kinase
MTPEHSRFPRVMSLAVHELRTPVTVVSGYLRMLLREQGGPISDKQRKMLEEAERSCARIGALVAELSELGKLEANELALSRQEFDLAALLAELASRMHEGDDRGVELRLQAHEPLGITGDRARLSAALGALIHSALRERGEPGVIAVEAVASGGDGGRWAVVAIGEESVVPALLEVSPGTTAAFDEWRGGLGMAIPVARRVIEAHGGTVWSVEGTQSRAASAFRLPLRQ